jgi:putative ABC transport system substrate-binding protein
VISDPIQSVRPRSGKAGLRTVRAALALAAAAATAGAGLSAAATSTSKPARPAARSGTASRTGRVVIVRSIAAPYLRAEKALADCLTRRGHRSESFPIEELPKTLVVSAGANDLFIAIGTQAARHLHGALPAGTRMTYCMVADPAGAGLIGMSCPAGVSTDVPLDAQFKLIAEALPRARSLATLYRSGSPRSRRVLRRAREKLPKGWRLHAVDMDAHHSVAAAISSLLDLDADIVWTAPDAAVYNVATIRSLLLNAVRRKRPVFGFSTAFVRAGALLGVGIDPDTQGRQAGELAHAMLRAPTRAGPGRRVHASPGLSQPAPEFHITVNLIVARNLSVRLPEGLIRRARFVFGRKTPSVPRDRPDGHSTEVPQRGRLADR